MVREQIYLRNAALDDYHYCLLVIGLIGHFSLVYLQNCIIHVIQGETEECELFDSSTATPLHWLSIAHPNTVRWEGAKAAVCSDRVCVFGGWTRDVKEIQTVEEYDSASNGWTELTDARMPQFGRVLFGIGTLTMTLSGVNDTLVYIVGGAIDKNSRHLNTVLRFSGKEKRWLSTDAHSLPIQCCYNAVATINMPVNRIAQLRQQ